MNTNKQCSVCGDQSVLRNGKLLCLRHEKQRKNLEETEALATALRERRKKQYWTNRGK